MGAGGPGSGENLMTHHSASWVGVDCLEQPLNPGRSELSAAAGQRSQASASEALQSLAHSQRKAAKVSWRGRLHTLLLNSVGESKERTFNCSTCQSDLHYSRLFEQPGKIHCRLPGIFKVSGVLKLKIN